MVVLLRPLLELLLDLQREDVALAGAPGAVAVRLAALAPEHPQPQCGSIDGAPDSGLLQRLPARRLVHVLVVLPPALGEDEVVPVGCGDHEHLGLPVVGDAVRHAPGDEAVLVVVALPQPALPRHEGRLRLRRHCFICKDKQKCTAPA
uniref:Uncharacterized protein n=1 Tax=Arundo donax TaxID=35708 RepID=A0A0A9EGG8_ARUDO